LAEETQPSRPDRRARRFGAPGGKSKLAEETQPSRPASRP